MENKYDESILDRMSDKMPVPLEADVLAACMDFLEMKGIKAWRQNNGGIPLHDGSGGFRPSTGMKGLCDISGILSDGRRFECEVKRPGKDGRDDQWAFIDMINQSGGVACLVHSVEELEQDLRSLNIIS
jgi:hypothetical protein